MCIRDSNYTSACSGVTAPANTNLPISMTDSEGYTRCYQYDALDRIVKVKYPDGTFDQYDYTFPAGLSSQPTWTTGAVPTAGSPSLDVWKITDRLGRITNYVYDRNRQLIKASETVTVGGSAVTRTTAYAYYANGTLKELTDANGNVTRWDIDIQSRPTAKTYAFGTANAKTESFTYDIVGRLKTRTDARGQTLTYTYNKDDTVASYAFTNAVVATPGANFVYDTWFPRRTSMADQFGTTTWTYKAVGTNGALKPDVEDGPFANDSITIAYDAAGRANSRTISGTAAETFGFDTLGRMNSHVTALGSFSYGHLGNSGQVTSRTIGGITTSWGYDTNTNDRRLLTITNNGSAARNYGVTSNAYQLTGMAETMPGTHPWLSQTRAFTYDASDRLLTATASQTGNQTYALDKMDNITTLTDGAAITGTHNNLNQISSWSGLTYSYDNNGNLTGGDGTKTYTFDAADRLIRINYVGSATKKSEFAYDGIGRRLRLIETPASGSAITTRYLWCGNRICQTRDGADAVQVRYYKEGEYRLSGTKKYLYQFDQLDSVRDLVDITGTATLVGAFDYKPYGAIQRTSGTITSGYLYAGLYHHPVSSLYLSATRFYDPVTGKWLHRDPIGEAGDPNTYGYGAASPLRLVDPDGMATAVAEGPIVRPSTGVIAGGGFVGACMDGPWTCAAAAVVVTGVCVVALVDKFGNKTNPVAGSLAPPGDCNDDAYEKLKNSYKSHCSRAAAPACKGGDTAEVLSQKIGGHSRCIDARRDIMNICFRGGDDRHFPPIEERLNAITNCQDLLSKLRS